MWLFKTAKKMTDNTKSTIKETVIKIDETLMDNDTIIEDKEFENKFLKYYKYIWYSVIVYLTVSFLSYILS